MSPRAARGAASRRRDTGAPRDRSVRQPQQPDNDVAQVDTTALAQGAAQLGLSLSAAQVDRLAEYAQVLLRWNVIHNLTAIRGAGELLSHHLLDSLAIVPQIATRHPVDGLHILDVGSGGGLPAIPLAIALPTICVTAVDAVEKKVAFLQHARAELALANFSAEHGRVEALAPPPETAGGYGLIVSRAFSALEPFVRLSRHLLAPGGEWFAMKGVLPAAELAALPPDIRVLATVKLHVPLLAEQRHLIVLGR